MQFLGYRGGWYAAIRCHQQTLAVFPEVSQSPELSYKGVNCSAHLSRRQSTQLYVEVIGVSAGVTQEESHTMTVASFPAARPFLVLYLPQILSREEFSRPFPSFTVRSRCVQFCPISRQRGVREGTRLAVSGQTSASIVARLRYNISFSLVVVAKDEDAISPAWLPEIFVVGMRGLHDELGHVTAWARRKQKKIAPSGDRSRVAVVVLLSLLLATQTIPCHSHTYTSRKCSDDQPTLVSQATRATLNSGSNEGKPTSCAADSSTSDQACATHCGLILTTRTPRTAPS